MSDFAADLHIHSRFSRATSKGLTVRSLAAWAEVKGIGVLGTGDCTHPGWLAEVERELAEDGSGLLRLRDPSSLAGQIPGLPVTLSGSARFMLQGEISSIYKRGGRVRKVHNLVYLPTLQAAKSLNAKLAQVGNLAADGRPILGLDSRNLLEMVLETHPEAFLVPAHIWTPWFALFGSMSGFDSVEECFGDLAGHIFAMETGLSSDPAMNWTLSALDRYRMISNSDAHSGEKLGREANLLRGEASFSGIRGALRAHLPHGEGGGGAGDCAFLGTVEFYPEEGKYHLDGHRKCNWCMEPAETLAHKGLCPVCGKPATLGVLHRVLALADRPEPVQPHGQAGYCSLIPLREVLSEVLDVGPGSKAVTAEYFRLIERLGPELSILREAPVQDIARAAPVLAEAVERMRAGKVLRRAGFDGEYGVITVFTPEERAQMRQGRMLAGIPARRGRRPASGSGAAQPEPEAEAEGDPAPEHARAAQALPAGLNASQEAAAALGLGDAPVPALVLAGPGTGKTHTLVARVERLLETGVAPESIAVITFTRRAADELHERLAARFGPQARLPLADTLHALALDLWAARRGQPPVLLSEDAARRMFLEALAQAGGRELTKPRRLELFRGHALARETLSPLPRPDAALVSAAWDLVREAKALRNQADFTDLLEFLLTTVSEPGFAAPFAHLLVDEAQDLSLLQLRAVLGLAGQSGAGFFAIGDPNQSIYAFRGAAGDLRQRLAARWPHLAVATLAENYRSGQGILDAAALLLPEPPMLRALPERTWDMELLEAPDARHEASLIASRAAALLGGTSLTLMDRTADCGLAPGDVAVLVRLRALIPPLKAALELAGLPCSAPETEMFWEEPRAALILRAAGRLFGLPESEPSGEPGGEPGGEPPLAEAQAALPDFLLLQGPRVLPAALRETPPFDRFFWDGAAFRDLCHAFDEGRGWVGLLDRVRLETGYASIRQAAQKVRILTMHAAKGLEFEAVFLPALERGLLPLCGHGAQDGEPAPEVLAEERRLLYVAMTRAKSRLCLSFARSRTLYGAATFRDPSPLLEELLAQLPAHALRRTVLAQKIQTRQTHLSLF